MISPTRREILTAGAVGVTALAGSSALAQEVRRPNEKPKLRLSLAAYSFRDHLQGKLQPNMDLDGFIDLAAMYEVDGVELTSYYYPKEVTPAYVAGLKRHAYLKGLDVTGIPVGNTFTYGPGEKLDKEIAHVKTWLQVARDLGAPAMRIFAGNLQPGQTLAEAQANTVSAIRACLEAAERCGVLLGLENHGGIVAEADSLLKIVKDVNSPWCGINLDTGNFRTADPYGDMERCAPLAVSCQVKTEIQPKGMAKGPADMKRIMEILKKTGFRGYATLEYEASEPPMTGVPKALVEMRAAM